MSLVFQEFLHTSVRAKDQRDLLVNFMASVIQRPGRRLGYAPLIIGSEGCGKNLLMAILLDAVGPVDSYSPTAAQLKGNGKYINDWAENRSFIGVQEFTSANRALVRTLVTEPLIQVRRKGKGTVWVENNANLMLCAKSWYKPKNAPHLIEIHMWYSERETRRLYEAARSMEIVNHLRGIKL